MANVKITDLTEDATPADGDWVETVDISAGASKKVTRTNFFLNPPLGAGSVDPEDLVAGTGTSWAWQAWTPTWANLTIGNSVVDGKYIQIGKTVFWRLVVDLGTTSSVGSAPTFTLPVTSIATPSTRMPIGEAYYSAASTTLRPGVAQWATTTTANLLTLDVNADTGSVTATNPITFDGNSVILMQGSYEAA